ncbi:MAG TPA: FtsX-like permease family protein, partial [Dehalococcoidia bacterium]|nr:FtsX-like permease family protein [Dehalococcoidia bacterium]
MSLEPQKRPGNLPADGGMVARRAVIRWAWRLFHREWRQQLLVLALLTLATAATILCATAMYNLTPAQDNAEFGSADHYIRLEASPGADVVEANVAAAREWFGVIDVLLQRAESVPGSVDQLEFRAQDPRGAFSGPMLALREGRYPTAAGEVAVTDGVAKTLDLDIGTQFNLGGAWMVVGLVENPNDLNTEFALTSPSHLDRPESVTILVGGSSARFESFQPVGDELSLLLVKREPYEQILATGVVLAGAAVVLLFVALVAATGFVVLAQRRLRQLGMLAAIGATEKHIRLVMVANGFVIGVVATSLGLAIGVAVWLAISPLLETAIGYRIDTLNVPWWLIAISGLLAVATATLAAWWPARLAARVPVTQALSGRPSRPHPEHRSAGKAVLLGVGGLACLALGDPTKISDRSLANLDQVLLVFGGTLATVSGI